MFIAALFTIAKLWKQHKELFPNSSSMDESIKNVWYYICCIYSTKRQKNNKILAICDNLDDLEGIMVIKSGKDKYCMISLTCII